MKGSLPHADPNNMPPPQPDHCALVWTAILNAFIQVPNGSPAENRLGAHTPFLLLQLLNKALLGIRETAVDHHRSCPNHLAFILLSVGILAHQRVGSGSPAWSECLDLCLDLSLTQHAWHAPFHLPDACAATVGRILGLLQDAGQRHVLQSKLDAYTHRITAHLTAQSPFYALSATLQVVLNHIHLHKYALSPELSIAVIQSLPRSIHESSFYLFSHCLQRTPMTSHSPLCIEIEALNALVHPHTLRINTWSVSRGHLLGLLLGVLERDGDECQTFSFGPLSRVLHHIIATHPPDGGATRFDTCMRDVVELVYLMTSRMSGLLHVPHTAILRDEPHVLVDWVVSTAKSATSLDDVRHLVLSLAHLANFIPRSPLCSVILHLSPRWSFHNRYAAIILESIRIAPSLLFVNDGASSISVLELVNATRVREIKSQFTNWLLHVGIPTYFQNKPTITSSEGRDHELRAFVGFLKHPFLSSIHPFEQYQVYQSLSVYPDLLGTLFPSIQPIQPNSKVSETISKDTSGHFSTLVPSDTFHGDPLYGLQLPTSWAHMIALNYSQEGVTFSKLGLEPLAFKVPDLLVDSLHVCTEPVSIPEMTQLAQLQTHNLMISVMDMLHNKPSALDTTASPAVAAPNPWLSPTSPGGGPVLMDMTDTELYNSLPVSDN